MKWGPPFRAHSRSMGSKCRCESCVADQGRVVTIGPATYERLADYADRTGPSIEDALEMALSDGRKA